MDMDFTASIKKANILNFAKSLKDKMKNEILVKESRTSASLRPAGFFIFYR